MTQHPPKRGGSTSQTRHWLQKRSAHLVRLLRIISIVTLLALGWLISFSTAQDDETPQPTGFVVPEEFEEYDGEYAGTLECRSCHRRTANDHAASFHGLTLVNVEDADDLEVEMLADFDSGEDLRTVAFADGETRPFTADDVVFMLGAGRNYQTYVMETAEGVYRVLPAQWHIASASWAPTDLADDWQDAAYDFSTQCAACHTTNFHAESFTWDEDGVQCESCHGPGLLHVALADDAGSSISDDEYVGIAGSINFGLTSETCGQCHVRGAHAGTGLPFPVGYVPGEDDLLAESIFSPSQPGDMEWFETGHARLPNMQYNEWLQSSHGQSLEAAREAEGFTAACLGCHSAAENRADYLIEFEYVDEDEFNPVTLLDTHGLGITCASCHNPHEPEGPANLVAEDAYTLCTDCHRNIEEDELVLEFDDAPELDPETAAAYAIHHPVQELYEGTQILAEIDPVAGAHFSAEDGPDCMTCHMHSVDTKNGLRHSHAFHPVSPAGAADLADLQDSCSTCHSDIEDPRQLQDLIDSVQGNVRDRLDRARAEITAETAPWVTQALDAVEGDGSYGMHNVAYTNALLVAVETELGVAAATLGEADVAQQVADRLPPPLPANTEQPTEIVPSSQGLTGPSWVILGICALITLYSAYAFFIRGGRNESPDAS